MIFKFSTLIIFLFITLVTFSRGCENDQMHHACRIYNAQCNCGYGCKSEYRYLNQEDCKVALKGKKDYCSPKNPCLNNGTCLQISTPPRYKCSCEGTQFHGDRCQKACPTSRGRHQRSFPVECTVI